MGCAKHFAPTTMSMRRFRTSLPTNIAAGSPQCRVKRCLNFIATYMKKLATRIRIGYLARSWRASRREEANSDAKPHMDWDFFERNPAGDANTTSQARIIIEGDHSISPLEIFVREVLQNSLDAARE